MLSLSIFPVPQASLGLTLEFSQIMDDFFNKHVLEFGAVNITGIRILQSQNRVYKDFLRHLRPAIKSKSSKFAEESMTVSVPIVETR